MARFANSPSNIHRLQVICGVGVRQPSCIFLQSGVADVRPRFAAADRGLVYRLGNKDHQSGRTKGL
jgi:hypothetical protein